MPETKVNTGIQNNEILNSFFQEALEFVETIEANLLELISNPADTERLSEAFRLMHSLKGNAGFMEQTAIEKLAHACEDILDAQKNSTSQIDRRTNHLLIEAVDYLKQLICGKAGKDAPEQTTLLENLTAELLLLENLQPKQKTNHSSADDSDDFWQGGDNITSGNKPADALNLLTELQKVIYQSSQPGIKPENTAFGIIAAKLTEQLCDLKSPTIQTLLSKTTAICNFYSNKKIEIPDEVLNLLTDLSDLLDGSLLNLQAGNNPEISGLENLLIPLDLELKRISPELILAAAGKPEKTAIESNLTIPDKAVNAPETEKSSGGFNSFRQTDIRVNLEKLDQLLDLTGELVIAGSLIMNSRKSGEDELEKAVDSLNRIIRDLQETTMNMRLLPFSLLFSRMQKLVYSLSTKANKKIRLITAGENTEVDKSLLEAVSDPLVHLIRNAVDHGLEQTEERALAGKQEEGIIRLEAILAGSEIQLSVKDDGRGLNLEKIKSKAVSQQLIEPDSNITEAEIINLLFLPGFSTADKVTEISGRGVGMDVVKKNIEKIKGSIKIFSEAGKGTEIRISIPLTLTILEGLLIRTGASQYIIPLDSIVETFIASNEELTIMPDGCELVRKRNRLYPIIRLHRLHKISNTKTDLTSGVLLLIKAGENEAMLFIDEIIGQETTVIKSLPDYLGNLKTVSGCAILGSGEVCQILHIPAILDNSKTDIINCV